MRRAIIIAVLLVVGAGVVGVITLSSKPQMCTQIGCTDTLTISVPTETAERIKGATYIAIDGTIINDPCTNKDDAEIFGEQIRIRPSVLGHGSGQETIEELQIGHRRICDQEPTILHELTDHDITYTSFQPNGPGCPPTCLQASIEINTSGS